MGRTMDVMGRRMGVMGKRLVIVDWGKSRMMDVDVMYSDMRMVEVGVGGGGCMGKRMVIWMGIRGVAWRVGVARH